ncbi:MAG: ribosome small subunit-dependent GTPase A [Spirochaetes bacterium GWF1_41_5]|nr:MAG: ribosome small subunit-dependent GTPase A [Spirochaetes bacterium GWF1_41_5]
MSETKLTDIYGWKNFSENSGFDIQGIVGRLVSQKGNVYFCITDQGEKPARLSGRFSFKAQNQEAMPAAGDWVTLQEKSPGSFKIHSLLPRKNALSRRSPEEEQSTVLAANIDLVFIVLSAESYREGLAERYLALVASCNLASCLIINKADLAGHDLPHNEIKLSAQTGFNMQALTSLLQPFLTYVFIGPSGAGKSTIVNFLLHEQKQETGEVRENDRRGRHVTSCRSMFVCPNGSLLLDTPGIRETGIAAECPEDVFKKISILSGRCRFRDCTHENEPGCAVKEALEQKELSWREYNNYRKISDEAGWQNNVQKQILSRSEKTKWRQIKDPFRKTRSKGRPDDTGE